jgi:hypothetical protein
LNDSCQLASCTLTFNNGFNYVNYASPNAGASVGSDGRFNIVANGYSPLAQVNRFKIACDDSK